MCVCVCVCALVCLCVLLNQCDIPIVVFLIVHRVLVWSLSCLKLFR